METRALRSAPTARLNPAVLGTQPLPQAELPQTSLTSAPAPPPPNADEHYRAAQEDLRRKDLRASRLEDLELWQRIMELRWLQILKDALRKKAFLARLGLGPAPSADLPVGLSSVSAVTAYMAEAVSISSGAASDLKKRALRLV